MMQLNQDPVTLTRYLISKQQAIKDATGDFTLLISAIQTACKFIGTKVRRAGIANLQGLGGGSPTSSKRETSLYEIANEVFINVITSSHKACAIASYQNDEVIVVKTENAGKYVVALDPLDGRSNLDASIVTGSIFGIWKRKTYEGQPIEAKDYLQSGDSMIAGGYCIFGAAIQIVLSTGGQTDVFTLDPSLGEFVLTRQNIKVPESGTVYSINEGYHNQWDPKLQATVQKFKDQSMALRYEGTLVADFHRILTQGGIFLYPADNNQPTGKLKTVFELQPLSFIITNAGGKSITGKQGSPCQDIIGLVPKSLHERIPVFFGSTANIASIRDIYKN